MKRIVQGLAATGLLLALWACGRKIGDECKTQLDCNEEDDSRTCDISQPGGYCTIEGCDETSCPKESACIRFFPAEEFLSDRCDPAASTCDSHELCLESGWCAPLAAEQRRCLLRCKNNGDCRDEYECRGTPQHSSMALTTTPGAQVGFCAPRSR